MFILNVNSIRKKATFIILFVPMILFADFWMIPYPQEYFSDDSTYSLIIIPRFVEENTLPILDSLLKNKVRPDEPEDYEYCIGELYKLTDRNDYMMVRRMQLVNVFSPTHALVSNDGCYVITFDEWSSVGYGDNVVVVYGPHGKLIKKYALEDIISQEEIDGVVHSITSRFWSGGHYLNEIDEALILCILTKRKQLYVREVKIDLKSGDFLRDDTVKTDTVPYKDVKVKPTPILLPTIRGHLGKSWVKFKIKIELLVDIDGHVVYATIPKPDWLYRWYQGYALTEAKKTRFTPAKHENEPVRVWVKALYNVTANTATLELEN